MTSLFLILLCLLFGQVFASPFLCSLSQLDARFSKFCVESSSRHKREVSPALRCKNTFLDQMCCDNEKACAGEMVDPAYCKQCADSFLNVNCTCASWTPDSLPSPTSDTETPSTTSMTPSRQHGGNCKRCPQEPLEKTCCDNLEGCASGTVCMRLCSLCPLALVDVDCYCTQTKPTVNKTVTCSDCLMWKSSTGSDIFENMDDKIFAQCVDLLPSCGNTSETTSSTTSMTTPKVKFCGSSPRVVSCCSNETYCLTTSDPGCEECLEYVYPTVNCSCSKNIASQWLDLCERQTFYPWSFPDCHPIKLNGTGSSVSTSPTRRCRYSEYIGSKKRMIGGSDTTACSLPGFVFFNVGTPLCAGVLVDESTIITSRSCYNDHIKFAGGDVNAVIGEHDILSVDEENSQQSVVIPQSTPWTPIGGGQLFQVTLPNPVTLQSPCSLPACTPTPDMPIDFSTCKAVSIGNNGASPSIVAQEVPVTVDPSCTGDTLCSTGVAMCYGDSGGPLVCTTADTKETVIIGLINSESDCITAPNYNTDFVSLLNNSSYNSFLPHYQPV